MKIIAINGSARKNWNTSILLGKLFSAVLGRDVAVEKQGTILSGATGCTFVIHAM